MILVYSPVKKKKRRLLYEVGHLYETDNLMPFDIFFSNYVSLYFILHTL